MKKPVLLTIYLLALLMVGTTLIAEARSLSRNYVQIELEEEVEPRIINIVNKQDDKSSKKIERYLAKIDKKLRKLEDSYKQQHKDLESLSKVIVKLLNNLYITEDNTDSITTNVQKRIQQTEDHFNRLNWEMIFQNQEAEKLKQVQAMLSYDSKDEEFTVEQNPEMSGVSNSDSWNQKQTILPTLYYYLEARDLPTGFEESDSEQNEEHSDTEVYFQDSENEMVNKMAPNYFYDDITESSTVQPESQEDNVFSIIKRLFRNKDKGNDA